MSLHIPADDFTHLLLSMEKRKVKTRERTPEMTTLKEGGGGGSVVGVVGEGKGGGKCDS